MHAIDITLLQMRGQKMDYAHCPLRTIHPFPWSLILILLSPRHLVRNEAFRWHGNDDSIVIVRLSNEF